MCRFFTIIAVAFLCNVLNAQTVVDIIVDSPDHNTLEAAVIAAELDDDLSSAGPFTVFAPTDAAFAALPPAFVSGLLANPTGQLAEILTYHVLGAEVLSSALSDGQEAATLQMENVTVTINADGVFINNAQVIVADIQGSNGVVHVLDAVMLPPTFPTTIVDVVVNSEVHNTLEAAVIAAELADDLSAEGPFTLFAPTDAAFAALPPAFVSGLLANPTGQLAEILTYHVIGAQVLSGDLSDGQMATTLQGEDVTVTINMDGVFINNAQVIVADIVTPNGVVHVLDAVMLPPTFPTTIVDVVVNSEVHNTLEAAVIAAELADDLSAEGPFTLFAPTDAAFAALPPAFVSGLLANPTGQLAEILTYHVIGAQVLSGDLSDGQMATTLQGEDVTVTINTDGVFINNAQVIVADIVTPNGVVHVLDAVMLPPTFPTTIVDVVVNSEVHNTLEAAVIAAELADDLSAEGPFTLFAPTDAAFAALPPAFVSGLLANPTGQLAEILTYHVIGAQVLSGDLSDGQMATTLQGEDVTVTINMDGVFINNAQVIVADIVTPNGVVHVLDAVMLPPTFPTTIVDVVVNSEVHNTLEAAVIAAELADDLSAEGPFTLFAPTDAAFAALDPAVLQALLDDPTGQLAEILTYHVIGAQVLSGDLSDGQMATTLQGEDVTVTINTDGVFINNAQVIVADIVTPNGVVHVLDAVILPPSLVNVNELERVRLKVSPNPTTDYVQIELSEGMINTEVDIQVIDFMGRILETRTVNSRQANFDLTNYPTGNYSILLVNHSSYSINKIIKK